LKSWSFNPFLAVLDMCEPWAFIKLKYLVLRRKWRQADTDLESDNRMKFGSGRKKRARESVIHLFDRFKFKQPDSSLACSHDGERKGWFS